MNEEKYLNYKPNIQYINREDEQGRFMGMVAYLGTKTGQVTSHGCSYVWARRMESETFNESSGLENNNFKPYSELEKELKRTG